MLIYLKLDKPNECTEYKVEVEDHEDRIDLEHWTVVQASSFFGVQQADKNQNYALMWLGC